MKMERTKETPLSAALFLLLGMHAPLVLDAHDLMHLECGHGHGDVACGCVHEENGAESGRYGVHQEFSAAAFRGYEFGGRHRTLATTVECALPGNLNAGTALSWIWAEADGRHRSGLGNPEVFVDTTLAGPCGSEWILGMHLEMPLGDDDRGVAGDHWTLIPHVGVGKEIGKWSWFAATGLSRTIESGHEDAHGDFEEELAHALHPHGELEWIVQAGIGHAITDAVNLVLVFDGQRIVSGETHGGRNFLNAGPRLSWRCTRDMTLAAGVLIPLRSDERYRWKAQLGCQLGF